MCWVEGLSPPKLPGGECDGARQERPADIARRWASEDDFGRARSSSVSSSDRLAISAASASRPIADALRFMIGSLYISRLSDRLPSSDVVLLEALDFPPMTPHCSMPHGASRARRRIRAILALPRKRLLLGFGSPIRLPIASIIGPYAPIASLSSSARIRLGKMGETARFTRRPERTSRRALTAQGDLERKWNNQNWRTKQA